MKSFNDHIDNKREELKEADPLDDLTAVLGVAAAGLGAWGLKKGWDRFGKDAVASLPFAPDKWKAAKKDREKEREAEKAKIAKTLAGPDDTEKAQAKLDKEKKKKDDDQTKADAAMIGKKRDSEGNLAKQKDAQQSKDISGQAPPGWITSKGKPGSPADGDVWKKSDHDKWMETRKKDTEKKLGARAAKKSASKKDDETASYMHTAKKELSEFEEKDRNEILEHLVLEETMSLEESQELQAIMALDDAGIKADINRKGQVVIKKKDKKKAHIALEKSFKKGGWPPLKLEDVDEHKGTEPHKHPHEDEELDEASSKKARNKAADEIEKIADKGGAEAPTLFSLASKLRKGTHSTTGLKLSKQVTSILKDNGIKEEVDLNTYQEMKMSMAAKKKRALWAKTAAGKKSAKKSKIRAKKVRAGSIKIDKAKGRKMAMARKKGGIRDAYEIVSEARNRAKENKPEWETEDSRLS